MRAKFGGLEQTQGLHFYTYLPNFIWMCSLCQLPVAKNHNFGQILTLLGAPVATPFYRWGPNLVGWSRPKVYTYLPNFIWMCSLCRLPMGKNHNFGKFWHFWGLLYRPPFTDEGQMWCAIADPQYKLTCQISSGSVYSVALCWRKSQIFADFWTSAFSVVANWQQSDKVEHGYHNYKPSPI